MQPPPFGYEQIATELLRGILDIVADTPGQSPERKAIAQHTVVCSVMAHNPRDPVEIAIAGQCIIYDALMRDGARDILRGQEELTKIRNRPGVLAAGKMYLATLETLCRMQGRPADHLAFARPIEDQHGVAAKPAETAEEDAARVVTPNPPAPREPVRPTPAMPPKTGVPSPAPSVTRTPEPKPNGVAAVAPEPPAFMSLEQVEDMLLAGLSDAEKQDIRRAVAHTMLGHDDRESGDAEPRAA